ncbi:hypothetical protein CBL_08119 [Carabus blaptoides fortunei]
MDCVSNISTTLSDKSPMKRKTQYQLDNTMHVLSDDDLSDADDAERDDFIKKDHSTSQKQSTLRNKCVNSSKSPRKKQRINEENTQPTKSKTNLTNIKNSITQSSGAKEAKSGSSKSVRPKLNKPNVSRNIFPKKKEQSVQTDKNETETNISVTSGQSTLAISENCNLPGAKRILNVSIQVNLDDISKEKNVRLQQTQTGQEKNSNSPKQMPASITSKQICRTSLENEANVSKNKTSPIATPKSSPSKQNTLTLMNFKTNKTQTLNKCKPQTKTNTSSETKIKKINSKYNAESNTRLCEYVHTILTWVQGNDYFKLLFTKNEIDLLLALFNAEDKRPKIICLRLYTRLPKWYNLQNFCKEINLNFSGNLLQNMLEHKFVENDFSHVPIRDLLEMLTREDLKKICDSFKLKKALSKKQSFIDALVDHSKQQSTLTSLMRTDDILRKRVTETMGVCVKLSSNLRNILNYIHDLYSLTNSDLETPNDIYFRMGKVQNETLKYPKVKIELTCIFKDRQQFLSYKRSLILRDDFEKQKVKNVENVYLLCSEAYRRLKELLADEELTRFHKDKPLFLRRFSAPWVYCNVLYSGSQKLGKHYPCKVCEWLSNMLKQEIYCVYKRGLWYIQKCLVQKTHLRELASVAETIRDGLSDKWVTLVDQYELSDRGSKIKKGNLPQLLYDEVKLALLPKCDPPRCREIAATAVHNNDPGRKKHFVTHTSEGKEYASVEQTAIKHYTTELNYTDGIHCEGRLLTTLFFILFWDVLYEQHVPYTYISELQSMPLDLCSGEFYKNRTVKIDARLKDIRENWSLDTLCLYVTKIYNLHTDELRSVQPYEFSDDTTLQMFVRCLGKNVLAAVCERLVKDYKQFRSGLPDLFLWNAKDLKCCFVEVKSENDSLSINQILWLHYLNTFGADVEVCYVKSMMK